MLKCFGIKSSKDKTVSPADILKIEKIVSSELNDDFEMEILEAAFVDYQKTRDKLPKLTSSDSFIPDQVDLLPPTISDSKNYTENNPSMFCAIQLKSEVFVIQKDFFITVGIHKSKFFCLKIYFPGKYCNRNFFFFFDRCN